MITENLTQKVAMLGAIVPGASQFATGSYVTEAADGSVYARVAALVSIGTLAGAGTVFAKFQHCSGSLSSDSAWTDVNASAATSTFASGSNSKMAALELRVDQNPVLSRYVRALASVATSTWNGGLIMIGIPQYRPAVDIDSANVVQIVVY